MTKRCPYVINETICSPASTVYAAGEINLARCPHNGKTPLQGCHFRPRYEGMSFDQKYNPDYRRQLFEATFK